MDYQKTADGVLKGVGGEGNIDSVVYCATRLRFTLKDPAKADRDAVKAVLGVITVAEAGGQFQVVIGNEVPEVYAALPRRVKSEAKVGAAKGSLFNRFIAMISAIFQPILWIIAASGLLKALLAMSVSFGWINAGGGDVPPSTEYIVLNALADSIFYFLPLALAITSARFFKAQEFTSMAIAGALVYPSLVALFPAIGTPPTTLAFIGIPMTLLGAYNGSVIPIIVIVWVQSMLERLLYPRLWSAIRRFVVPMIILLVLVPLALIIVGPLATWISLGLANAISWVFATVPIIGGALMGGLWQVLVIFGLHWGVVPVFITEFATTGVILLLAPVFAAVFGQGAAALGVWIRTHNAARRSLAAPATLSAFIAGITEPALYGINLPLKRPFAFGLVGGAVGGAVIAAGGAASNNPAPPSGLGFIPSLLPQDGFVLAAIGAVASIVVALVLTLVFFKEPADNVILSEDAEVFSPLDGRVVALEQVQDPAFASGSLGAGVAVVPTGNVVHAPFAGTVVAVFPTGHAIGLRHEDGAEVLIHIGINTVKLAGEHFTIKARAGQTVAVGDVLVEFDRAAIEAAGFDTTSPIVITNVDKFGSIGDIATGEIAHGQPLFLAVAAGASVPA